MDKRLSIIIPVYNVKEYVERCILSIVTQPIYPENYELIVVNDGSTDKSENIIRRLSDDYPFIRLITQENKGLGAARNTGLDKATGEYIFFLDSDDYISENSLLPLLNVITTTEADIILFGISEIYPNGRKKAISFHLPEKNKLLSIDDYINNYTILSSACQGIIKLSLIETNKIRIPEGKLAEDDDFSIKIFSVADNLYYLPEQIYNYFQRSESISKNKGQAHKEKLISDRLEIFIGLTSYIKNYTGRKKSGLERKMNYLALDILRLLIRKRMSPDFIHKILDNLGATPYYPLVDNRYDKKYYLLSLLLKKPSTISFLASNKFLSRFF